MAFSAISSVLGGNPSPAFGCQSCKPDTRTRHLPPNVADAGDRVTLSVPVRPWPAAVVPQTAETFDEQVLNSPVPVLVDFYADWCPPCKALAPVLEGLAETSDAMPSQTRIAKVNVDEQETLTERYNISSMPTLVLFHHGKELARHSGAMDASALKQWVEEQLAEPAPQNVTNV